MIGAMKKSYAIRMLGGRNAEVAKHLNISRQAVFKWPDPLPKKVEAKVREAISKRSSPV